MDLHENEAELTVHFSRAPFAEARTHSNVIRKKVTVRDGNDSLLSTTGSRIIGAATQLFAQFGYHGVSTRVIANAAGVNQGTIFQHYPHKRDLYAAVLQSAMRQIRLPEDFSSRIAEADDVRTALAIAFAIIHDSLLQKHDVVRILQYTALEQGVEFTPLLSTQLGEMVTAVALALEPWMLRGDLRSPDTKTIVLDFVAIAVSCRSLMHLFIGKDVAPNGMFDVCAKMHIAER